MPASERELRSMPPGRSHSCNCFFYISLARKLVQAADGGGAGTYGKQGIDIQVVCKINNVQICDVIHACTGNELVCKLVAKIIQAFGETKVIKGSLLLTSTAYIVLLFATHFWSIFPVTSIIFFATSMLRPALNTQLSKMAGNEQGYVAGMNNAYMSLGNIVGPTLAGFLFDANIFAPFIAGCCILFITFLMIVRWN